MVNSQEWREAVVAHVHHRLSALSPSTQMAMRSIRWSISVAAPSLPLGVQYTSLSRLCRSSKLQASTSITPQRVWCSHLQDPFDNYTASKGTWCPGLLLRASCSPATLPQLHPTLCCGGPLPLLLLAIRSILARDAHPNRLHDAYWLQMLLIVSSETTNNTIISFTLGFAFPSNKESTSKS